MATKPYEVTVTEASKELSAKEKIRLKDLSNSINLDALTQQEGKVVIDVDYYALLAIHNEKSKERKDYENIVIVDKGGNKYNTGSSSFMTAFLDILDELEDAGETDCQIEAYRKESKNYKGKEFITCSIV